MTLEELNEIETNLLKRIEWYKKTQSNTKELDRDLAVVRLAKIGLEAKVIKQLL